MKEKTNLVFGKKNYTLMLAGIGVICLGFIIMSMDSEQHGFGSLGLTVGPLVLLAGFGIQFFAILAKDEAPDALPETMEKASAPAQRASTTSQASGSTSSRKKRRVKK